ncbi:MAG TPA: hypothetical protein VKE92_08865, partial [Anaerolineales bacterium]|nr:hypothetical protein [Anaerolineales bacterium]
HSRRKIFIGYDQLMDNPLQECTRLCTFLDQHCERSSQDSQKRIDTMLPRVAKNQQHQHYDFSLAEMRQATRNRGLFITFFE